jgi:hypothetical protein
VISRTHNQAHLKCVRESTYHQTPGNDHLILPRIVAIPTPVAPAAMPRSKLISPSVSFLGPVSTIVVRPSPLKLSRHVRGPPRTRVGIVMGSPAAEGVVGGRDGLEALMAFGGGEVPARRRVGMVRAHKVVICGRGIRSQSSCGHNKQRYMLTSIFDLHLGCPGSQVKYLVRCGIRVVRVRVSDRSGGCSGACCQDSNPASLFSRYQWHTALSG